MQGNKLYNVPFALFRWISTIYSVLYRSEPNMVDEDRFCLLAREGEPHDTIAVADVTSYERRASLCGCCSYDQASALAAVSTIVSLNRHINNRDCVSDVIAACVLQVFAVVIILHEILLERELFPSVQTLHSLLRASKFAQSRLERSVDHTSLVSHENCFVCALHSDTWTSIWESYIQLLLFQMEFWTSTISSS